MLSTPGAHRTPQPSDLLPPALRQLNLEALSVLAFVRSDSRAELLRNAGFDVIATKLEPGALPAVDARTHVVEAFPPDGETDARIAPLLRGAGSIAYASTTGVYGGLTGRINDATQVPLPTARAKRVLDAEQVRRASLATVLRCPQSTARTADPPELEL